jgi:hypothetical protein
VLKHDVAGQPIPCVLKLHDRSWAATRRVACSGTASCATR